MPPNFGLPNLTMQPFGATPEQEPDQFAQFTLEMFAPYDQKRALLMRQLAQAEALRRGSGVEHSTGVGGAFGAIADTINGFTGARQQAALQPQFAALDAQQAQGETKRAGLLDLMAKQKADAAARAKAAQDAAAKAEWDRQNAITSRQALQRAGVMAGLQSKARDDAEGRTLKKEERSAQAKAQQQMVEIEDRARGAERSLSEMEKLISEKGIFEMGGAHNAELQGAITAYVTDIAKLRDPGGVVRDSDVKMEMAGMFPTGIMGAFSSDATAKQVIGTLRKRLSERRAEAFKVRGLTPPSAATSADGVQLDAPTGLSPAEQAEFEQLKAELGEE